MAAQTTRRAWAAVGRRLESLGGRLVFIVCATLGLTAGATLAVAAALWSHQMETIHRARFLDVVGEVHDLIARDQRRFDLRLRRNDFRHYEIEPYPWPDGRAEDRGLAAEARTVLGPRSDPHVMRVDDRMRCIAPHEDGHPPQFGCYYLRFSAPNGGAYAIEVDRDTVRNFDLGVFEPAYLAVIAAESVLLAVMISRLTLKPLRRLGEASQSFAQSLDPTLLPETGPREIRLALRTFNLMQQRVRDGVTARTQLLASIAHDLQTPLTRMRIRLEQVGDLALRERLLADLAITLGLVRSGLDLAASSDSDDAWAVVELDPLLDAIATDAQETGRDLTSEAASGLRVRVKPRALSRTLQNMCDNAWRHAGAARLRVRTAPGEVRILVEDRGPGLPEDQLEAVFTPFARLIGRSEGRQSQEGSGLGLAIARAQAATFGAQIKLENRDGGGLCAILIVKNTIG